MIISRNLSSTNFRELTKTIFRNFRNWATPDFATLSIINRFIKLRGKRVLEFFKMAIIDMQAMRYINLLDKVSKVRTRRCFVYNNVIFFAVNKGQVSRAIGPSASNIRKIQESIGVRVKIIREAEDIDGLKRFIEDIVAPVRPRAIELKEDKVVITAGNNQNKASLIGRDKRRFEEMKKIVADVFGKELKII